MDIVQIQEKYWGHSYKAQCYSVDIQTLYESICTLDSYDTIFKKFIKTIEENKLKSIVLVDENFTVYIIIDTNKVETFKLGEKYGLVFNEVINNYTRRLTLTKDSWDDFIVETMWIPFDTEKNEIAIFKGVRKYKLKPLWVKEKIVKVTYNNIISLISKDNTFVSSMIIALINELKAIVYWEEDKVIALYFKSNALLPLNLNEKTYDLMMNHIKRLELDNG